MNRFSGKCEITEFAENQEEAEKQLSGMVYYL